MGNSNNLGTGTFTILGLVAVLIWGTAVGIAGSLAQSIGGLTSAGLIYLIAGPLCFLTLRLRGELKSSFASLRLRPVIICFVFFALNLLCFWAALSLSKTPIQVAELGVINYLWPTLTLLFSIPILKRRSSAAFFFGILIATTGVMIPLVQVRGLSLDSLTVNVFEDPYPYLLVFTCACAWGCYSNLTRKFQGSITSAAIASYLTLIGATLLLVGALSNEPHIFTKEAILEVIFLGVGDALAYIFWDLGMRRGNSIAVAAFSYVTPLISTAFTALYLNAHLSLSIWIGCALTVLGAELSRRNLQEPLPR